MVRSRAKFTQAEITRAVRALVSAGLRVSGLRVDADGFTVLTDTVPVPAPPGDAKSANETFGQWMKEQEDGGDEKPSRAIKRPRPIM
jgi:hypothetical protein